MNKRRGFGVSALLGGLLLGVAGLAQAAALELRFVEPEKFVDAGESRIEREQTLSQLEAYMRGLADKRLPAGQKLLIEVLDVNLAGEIEPRGRMMDRIRIVKDVSWPTMELRYVLSEGDKTLREGRARLKDMDFLFGSNVRAGNEPLRYEKHMLDDWFKKEFAAGKP